jgi:hypothetical protein
MKKCYLILKVSPKFYCWIRKKYKFFKLIVLLKIKLKVNYIDVMRKKTLRNLYLQLSNHWHNSLIIICYTFCFIEFSVYHGILKISSKVYFKWTKFTTKIFEKNVKKVNYFEFRTNSLEIRA